MLVLSVVLLVLGAGYFWLDRAVHRQEERESDVPRPAYTCQECGRRVDYGATVRPIRLTLLCPDDYHRRYGALRPVPAPEAGRRRGRRPAGPPPPMLLFPRR